MNLRKGMVSGYAALACLCFSLTNSRLLGQQSVVLPARTTPLAPGVIAEDKPLPVVVNGFLLVRNLFIYDDRTPSVLAYDRKGTLFSQAKLWFPDTVKASIRSVTINESGTMAISGSVVGRDGVVAHVIGLVAPPGKLTRVIRTNPFLATKLTFGPDGTIWALGRNLST